jgi:hypothetical protein
MAGKTIEIAEDKAVVQLVLDLEGAGALTPTSLTLTDPDLPYEKWESLGRLFGRIDRASRWWIGDWIIFGEALYGEEAAQAVESSVSERYDEMHRVTGLDPGTLMNISSVCRKVAKSRRMVELPFSIHAEVAKLDPDDQTRWLKRCLEEGWSRSELREAIARELAGEPEPELADQDDDGGRLTLGEQIEQAARIVWQTGQPTSDGSALVPSESWSQLGSALGES